MKNELAFDTAKNPNGTLINLACGYISLNEITFVKENIVVSIEACTGEVVFNNLDSGKLLSVKAKMPSSGDEKYSEIKCIVQDGQIKLGFPQYTYKDNYPNCDGEHDRWTKTILDFHFLCYDIKSNQIVE
ncbi:MAG: hypothetical protein II328_03830 [Clostridia bacterium]|nr:hypothetical protein [Clostridia bacterium]